MLTRRHFLYALSGGLLSLTGCHRNPPSPAGTARTTPASTVVDPKAAAASRQITANPVRFTDISGPAGLHWAYTNGGTGRHRIIETVGGGVAFFDYNNDGQNFVGGIDAVAKHPAGDLVDRVVTADILGVADRRAFLAQHAAMDRAGLEVERRHGVDGVRHLVKPGGAQLRLR